jgi:hypothetical protein
MLSRSLSDPLVSPAWSWWLGKLRPVKADHWVQLSLGKIMGQNCNYEGNVYLKIFLSQLRPTAHFHFLLQWDVEGLPYHIHHSILAAGLHYPLLDWHGVSRHGVDEDYIRI